MLRIQWNTIEHSNICIIGAQGEGREKGEKEYNGKNIPNLMNFKIPQIGKLKDCAETHHNQ
jgi:hypothetical protein